MRTIEIVQDSVQAAVSLAVARRSLHGTVGALRAGQNLPEPSSTNLLLDRANSERAAYALRGAAENRRIAALETLPEILASTSLGGDPAEHDAITQDTYPPVCDDRDVAGDAFNKKVLADHDAKTLPVVSRSDERFRESNIETEPETDTQTETPLRYLLPA